MFCQVSRVLSALVYFIEAERGIWDVRFRHSFLGKSCVLVVQ